MIALFPCLSISLFPILYETPHFDTCNSCQSFSKVKGWHFPTIFTLRLAVPLRYFRPHKVAQFHQNQHETIALEVTVVGTENSQRPGLTCLQILPSFLRSPSSPAEQEGLHITDYWFLPEEWPGGQDCHWKPLPPCPPPTSPLYQTDSVIFILLLPLD